MMGYRIMLNRAACGPAGCGSHYGGLNERTGFGADSADYAERLAEWAKMELLKEKVKGKLDARYGKKLDALADTIVDVLVSELESQDERATKREELENQWDGVFYEGHETQHDSE